MIKKFIKDRIEHWSLPPAARAMRNADRRGLGTRDPGAERVIAEALA